MTNNKELREKLFRLQWLIQKQRVKQHAAMGPMGDNTRGQGRILAFLRMKDGMSTKDMSYMLGMRVSSLNELLAKLEKNGYITRQPSEQDKRVILIYLTEKGKQEEPDKEENIDILSCLTEEEIQTLNNYLERMIASLEKAVGTDENDTELFNWMTDARERMGEEEFRELMEMRKGFGAFPKMGPNGHFHHGAPPHHHAHPGEHPHHGDPRETPWGRPHDCREGFAKEEVVVEVDEESSPEENEVAK